MTTTADKDKVILGIDPGTNVLGYGVLIVNGNKVKMEAMGVIDLSHCKDVYLKLGRIATQLEHLIDSFHPDEMAIESPFYGKNIQSMLKLGRAQGVAIATAINRDIVIHEYAPTKVKLALTGNGNASKEQLQSMLEKIFHLNHEDMLKYLDATDALAIAYCHYMQRATIITAKTYNSWKDFIQKNSTRIRKQ
ncbi:MAG: crossover junction endodeoxyribonuclease RuvC [Prevotellaceae bacterium]|nr:crossover junction endodeoxyribonuclease RuvC [Candidatus Faecinaster equi]